jgi:hypothetical protein
MRVSRIITPWTPFQGSQKTSVVSGMMQSTRSESQVSQLIEIQHLCSKDLIIQSYLGNDYLRMINDGKVERNRSNSSMAAYELRVALWHRQMDLSPSWPLPNWDTDHLSAQTIIGPFSATVFHINRHPERVLKAAGLNTHRNVVNHAFTEPCLAKGMNERVHYAVNTFASHSTSSSGPRPNVSRPDTRVDALAELRAFPWAYLRVSGANFTHDIG